MKIAIDAIEPQAAIEEVSVKTGEDIVGGESGVSIDAEAFATGDITFAQTGTNVRSFSRKTRLGTYSFSVGFGFGVSSSFDPS